MRLPFGRFEKMVDEAEPSRGINRVCMAFRRGRLFCYATNGRLCVRTCVDASSNEILELEEMLGAKGIDPLKAGLMIEAKTFKLLQKGPCEIVCTNGQWFLRNKSGNMFPTEVDLSPRMVDMIEQVFTMEGEAPKLGDLGFNPDYLALCRDAVYGEDNDTLVRIELPVDPERALAMRHDTNGSAAMVMPAKNCAFQGIKELIEAAQDAMGPSRDRLAEMICKTFGAKYSEMSKVEDSTPGQ